MKNIAIRTARKGDAAALLGIYAPYVTDTVITFEYEVPSPEEFGERIAHTLERLPYLAAEEAGELVGYAYASPFKERAAYDWAVETSVYVKTDRRGEGIGWALYAALEALLKRQGVTNLNACISYPNPESVGFHERLGYRTVAHFTKCGYKLGAWHDMIWMEKLIGAHETPPRPFVPITRL